MPHHYSYPGVYIEEQPAKGAIQPIGTSTAAFIGAAREGPINQPTFITSFDEFRQLFDIRPLDGFYLWYAVRGFFENGGQRAYIVRASTGSPASLSLLDSRATGAQDVLRIEARELGVPAPTIDVTISHSSLVTTNAYRPNATVVQANGDRIQVGSAVDAAVFRPGDKVRIEDGPTHDEPVVQAVRGGLLILESPLTNTYTGGTVRLADLVSGDSVLRLEAAASGLGPGSVVEISQDGTGPETHVVRQVEAERISPTLVTYRVGLETPLTNGYDRSLGAVDIVAVSQEFDLTVAQGTDTEIRPNLSMARNHPRYVLTQLERDPFSLVTVREPDVPSNAAPADRRPIDVPGTLGGGAADQPQNLTLADYQDALDALRDIDDVNFIAVPDSTDLSVLLALLTHCEQMGDRFAIFDAPPGLPSTGPGSVREQVATLRSDRGFGALYYPWITVAHPDNGTISVPPSGHVAGVYARADVERGVHKAPANYTLNSALGVTVDMNDETQGVLNLDNINVLRVFPGQARPVVWGARTTVIPGETAWQYINIRRLLLFIEESIEEGIRWAVFEPNNLQLWEQLKRVITAFLTSVWRSGGLFGATAEEAFYVRIDEVLNPPAERQLGRLYIEIGLRPSYPAEFIIVRIGLWQDGAEVTES
jgi:phage tail sheath protein FI